MLDRAVIVGVVIAAGLALAGCSYTKADDSPVPSPTTLAVTPTARVSVVGTLPPITNAPTTTVVVGTFVIGGRVPTTDTRAVGATATVVREGTGESSALV